MSLFDDINRKLDDVDRKIVRLFYAQGTLTRSQLLVALGLDAKALDLDERLCKLRELGLIQSGDDVSAHCN